MRKRGAALLVALAVACKSEESAPPPPPGSCATLACLTSGVPPEACAEGMTSDGERGCKPVLPEQSCDGNAYAVPGLGACAIAGVDECASGFMLTPDGCTTAAPLDCDGNTISILGGAKCEPIAPCASDRYPKTTAPTLHVDAAYTGTDSDGTADKPFATIAAALARVDGTTKTLAIARGSYEVEAVVDKPVEIVGACQGEVSLQGPKSATGAVLTANADLTLRHVALSGPNIGIDVTRGTTKLLSARVHNTGGIGGVVVRSAGTLELDRVVVNGATGSGVVVMSGVATIRSSEIRRSVLDSSDGSGGVGVAAVTSIRKSPRVTIESTVIAHNPLYGVYASGAEVTVRSSLIADTGTLGGPEAAGFLARASSLPPKVTIGGSVVESAAGLGIGCFDGTAEIDRTTVHGTRAAKTGSSGLNLGVDPTTNKPVAAKVTRTSVIGTTQTGVLVRGGNVDLGSILIRSTSVAGKDQSAHGVFAERLGALPIVNVHDSLIEKSMGDGASINAGTMALDRVAIRDLTPNPDGRFGLGAVAFLDARGTRPTLTIKRSLIERVLESGAVSFGARLEVEGTVIRDIGPRASLGFFGHGVHFSADPKTALAADGFVHGSVITNVLEAGINAFLSNVEIDATTISAVRAGSLSTFGDGVTVASTNGALHVPASVVIRRTKIASTDRAAVSVFEADAAVSGLLATCTRIDLAIESVNGSQPPKLSDEGENLCGCDSFAACRATTARIEPIGR